MNDHDFISGKHGLSHGVITLAVIVVGTLLFGVVGNLVACGAAFTFYFIREARQHDSIYPGDWNVDGQQDLTAPAIVVMVNLIMVLIWSR